MIAIEVDRRSLAAEWHQAWQEWEELLWADTLRHALGELSLHADSERRDALSAEIRRLEDALGRDYLRHSALRFSWKPPLPIWMYDEG